MNGHTTKCCLNWCARGRMGTTKAPCLNLQLKMQVSAITINSLCISFCLTEEIISKITLILESHGSEARREYLEHDKLLTRRYSKSSVTSQ